MLNCYFSGRILFRLLVVIFTPAEKVEIIFCWRYREKILATAKELVEDTKQLVNGAAGGHEKLATAAQSASGTIDKLADVVKKGATSLGSEDPDTQVSGRVGGNAII